MRERGGTPFRQIFWSRNGAPANIVGHRWNANTEANHVVLVRLTLDQFIFWPKLPPNADLASKISKTLPGWHPRTSSAGVGDPVPHPPPARLDAVRGGASSPVAETCRSRKPFRQIKIYRYTLPQLSLLTFSQQLWTYLFQSTYQWLTNKCQWTELTLQCTITRMRRVLSSLSYLVLSIPINMSNFNVIIFLYSWLICIFLCFLKIWLFTDRCFVSDMTILFAYFIHCLTSSFYWRWPHSMRSRVYETVRCPSICPSVCPIRGSGFAAMGPSGRTYRSIAVWPALQRHEDTAQRAAANAGSATFPAA